MKTSSVFSNCPTIFFQYCYYVKTKKKVADFTIQKEKLSEIEYLSLDELEQIIALKDEEYTFSKSYYMPQLIKELKKRI